MLSIIKLESWADFFQIVQYATSHEIAEKFIEIGTANQYETNKFLTRALDTDSNAKLLEFFEHFFEAFVNKNEMVNFTGMQYDSFMEEFGETIAQSIRIVPELGWDMHEYEDHNAQDECFEKIVYLAQTQLDNNVTLEPNSFFDGSVFNQLGLAYFAREYSLIHGGSQDCLKEVIWEMTLERATGMTFAEACNSHAIENAMHEFEQALPAQEPENMGENEAFDVDWGF